MWPTAPGHVHVKKHQSKKEAFRSRSWCFTFEFCGKQKISRFCSNENQICKNWRKTSKRLPALECFLQISRKSAKIVFILWRKFTLLRHFYFEIPLLLKTVLIRIFVWENRKSDILVNSSFFHLAARFAVLFNVNVLLYSLISWHETIHVLNK